MKRTMMAILAGIFMAGGICSDIWAQAAAAPCEMLTSLSLPNTRVTLAQNVAAGQFTPPEGVRAVPVFKELPSFCRVAATLTPSGDSDIKIEVWLPAAGWNGMLRPTGNGGWAGSIGFGEMANLVREGYATGGTDTGHTGFTGSFLIGHPEKAIDFGYRAYHEMTVAAKAIITGFYGSGPKLSVIAQAGGGGRQAVSEAQRYPEDYDLIAVTGARRLQDVVSLRADLGLSGRTQDSGGECKQPE